LRPTFISYFGNQKVDLKQVFLMKPWQPNKTKHPTKGERNNKEKGLKFELEVQKPKWGHKGAKEKKLCSRTLTNYNKHIWKGKGNLKV
jgi:hypothetical protein